MRRTKIVATLGPATDDPAVLSAMLEGGVDVVRLNLSHGSAADLRRRVGLLRDAEERTGRGVALMFDTRGPEIRLGAFIGGRTEVHQGQEFSLHAGPEPGDAQGAPISWAGLLPLLKPGMPVLLDDGRVPLEVLRVDEARAICRVLADAELTDRRKLTVPGLPLPLPPLTDQDLSDLRLGAELGMDFVAASFTSTAGHVLEVRDALETAGSEAYVIAKLETPEGMENLAAILSVADGIMVARGDLGVECLPEEVPLMQKRAIAMANRVGKPVITATQMLESMVHEPSPTRAEASDVQNAILDGSDAVMLSGETATGRHPLEAVRFMARRAGGRTGSGRPLGARTPDTVPEAISAATVQIAQELGARAIVTASQGGHTTRMVARHRPEARIVAATPEPGVARAMNLVWGAHPLVVPASASAEELASRSIDAAVAAHLVEDGDVLVYTAGVPVGVPGTTNLIRVHTVGDVVLRGHGLGDATACGEVRRVRRAADFDGMPDGAVVVAQHTDASLVDGLGRAAALIAEEGGLTSHAAIVGLSLGIPVVVGASGALGLLRDGEPVTVDARRGLVYRGRVGGV